MKRISVIIPCYNVAAYIDKCMVSITAQTIGMEALEIICIDDASTDDTWEHLRKWEQMFPDDILLIRQPVNRRQGAARNLGLQYASAEWIAFVDADDWLEFDYFQRLYDPTTRYACEVVACGSMRDKAGLDDCFNENKRQTGKEYYLVTDTKELKEASLRLKLMGVGPAAKLIQKRLLVESGICFPEELAYEDQYWIPLLHLYTTSMYIIEERLYHYFWNPASTSLARNKDYHVDCFTIQMMIWQDYAERGLLNDFQEVLEEELLLDVGRFLATIVFYRDEPSFPFFQLEQRILRGLIPDLERVVERCAPGFPEQMQIALKALCAPVSKNGFYQMIEQMNRLSAEGGTENVS